MSKYKNTRCEVDGFKFASKLERDFYLACKAWKQQGYIHDFEMQTVFNLHGGIKYKLDFLICCGTPGDPIRCKKRYVEVKGYFTQVARLKKKLFEADYGTLEMHTSKSPWKP